MLMTLTYLRGNDEMVEFAPGCAVERRAGERLGLVLRSLQPAPDQDVAPRADPARKGSKRGSKKGGKCAVTGSNPTVHAPDEIGLPDAGGLVVGELIDPAAVCTSPAGYPTPPSDATIRTIRLLRKLGSAPREIADEVGMSVAAVKAVLADKAA